MSSGSDRFNFEEQAAGGGGGSFSPPITPPVTGTPGPNEYLQSDGMGNVAWAAKPSPGTVLVFNPGGVASPGVYTSWASLMTAFNQTVGLVTIVFDSSVNPALPIDIPSGGPYDFAYRANWAAINVTLITVKNTTGAATVKNVRSFMGPMIIDTDSTTHPPFQWDRIAGLSEPRVWLWRDVTIQSTLGTVPLIDVPISLSLTIYSSKSNIGAQGSTVATIQSSSSPSTLVLDLADRSICYENAVSSAVGTTVQINWGAEEQFNTTQSLALGTVTYNQVSDIAYTINDDFLSQPPGAYTWTTTPPSGAVAATASIPASSDATHQGAWASTTGTTAAGRSFSFIGNSTDPVIIFDSTSVYQCIEWLVRIPTVSAGGDTFFAQFGYADDPNSSTSGTYGVFFRVESTNLLSCVVRSAGSDVVVLSNLNFMTFPTNTWTRLRISHNSATCKFEMGNGRTGALSTVHTFSMSDPSFAAFSTNRISPVAKIQKQTGTTSRSIEYDRCRVF